VTQLGAEWRYPISATQVHRAHEGAEIRAAAWPLVPGRPLWMWAQCSIHMSVSAQRISSFHPPKADRRFEGGDVPSTRTRAAVRLALSEDAEGPVEPAPWIGQLLALGARAARYSSTHSDRQLIVVVSVPGRDFAAALLGCGWMLARPGPELPRPLNAMRILKTDTPVRVVTENKVMTSYFRGLDESHGSTRLRLASGQWQADKIRALVALPELEAAACQPRPVPGAISEMAHLTPDWDNRLCLPPRDLAIVGTQRWLRDDIEAYLWRCDEAEQVPDRMASLLLPQRKGAATWSTMLYRSAGFADMLPLPSDLKAVILDGAAAIRHVTEVETPLVFAVLDRSVADESAAELIIQVRNTRGAPVSVPHDLGWRCLAGIEVVAFTVAL